MGEELRGSTGGSGPRPWLGLTEAGRIVVLLALGVAISSADWIEPVGVGGGRDVQVVSGRVYRVASG